MSTTPLPDNGHERANKVGLGRPLKRSPDASDANVSGGFSQTQDGLPEGEGTTGDHDFDSGDAENRDGAS
jgi:hypothetical protein